MLNQTISAPTLAPSRWTDWRRGLTDRQAAMVRRYVVMVIVLSALGCIYLWQMNVIMELRQQTRAMRDQTEEIEGANAPLMLRLAQWQSPGHIEQAAKAAGWLRAETPIYVQVPFGAETQTSTIQTIASTQESR
jgi:hypothetical protein